MLDTSCSKSPRLDVSAFTAVAVITLVGIGANMAIFSIAQRRPVQPTSVHRARAFCCRGNGATRTHERSRAVRFMHLKIIDEHHRGLGEVGCRVPPSKTIHAGHSEAEWMETMAVTPA